MYTRLLSCPAASRLTAPCAGGRFPLTYIDGETSAVERPALCQQFSRQPQWAVALVSTRAGGQGLNIIGATAVIVFDPSWNPAHDLQAQDRSEQSRAERSSTVQYRTRPTTCSLRAGQNREDYGTRPMSFRFSTGQN